ncbi:hypothetical protein Sjap_007426 [Stephania japonica]|uniref:Uncharacterized protein n=1 Tax=Stephania japonica TaxID=461633 RepID=A0AAP0JPZ8_9MAGN
MTLDNRDAQNKRELPLKYRMNSFVEDDRAFGSIDVLIEDQRVSLEDALNILHILDLCLAY